MRVLVLGGTDEGRRLADRLATEPGVSPLSSLAGRVADPRLPAGEVRIGGFDGVDGLTAYLRERRVDAIVDATHPFASRITAQAVEACARVAVPITVLRRPGWVAGPGDAWYRVVDLGAAGAATAAAPDGTVLLTVGRRGLARFADDTRHDYVIRSVDAPDAGTPLPRRHRLVLARGPFTVDGERALLREHAITLLVTKDSGGEATAAKLAAARDLSVPVVMVDRPPVPPGVAVTASVDDAMTWVNGLPAR